jgi:hypothetical protein
MEAASPTEERTMKSIRILAAAIAMWLFLPAGACAAGIEGLWRFDIVNQAGTTYGAMTIQTRVMIDRQADEQQRWAEAKARGEAAPNVRPSSSGSQAGASGYAGFAMTDQGGHALPIEYVGIDKDALTMVVNSPRGLVIFRGTLSADEQRFEGKLTYHNGSVFTMRGVKQVRPLAPPSRP